MLRSFELLEMKVSFLLQKGLLHEWFRIVTQLVVVVREVVVVVDYFAFVDELIGLVEFFQFLAPMTRKKFPLVIQGLVFGDSLIGQFCKFCGMELKDPSSLFCSHCGKKLK